MKDLKQALMKKEIGLKQLHLNARLMKWYEFENWIAKELFNIHETVDSSELTNDLYLEYKKI